MNFKLELKASAILYMTSAIFLFCGIMLPLLEVIGRTQGYISDTFVELLEWNPYSQLGMICMAQALFLFWLGLLVDRRSV